jgi:hypothetical protein
MSEPHMESFEAFWPYYVREHLHPMNRALHYAGTTMVIGSVAAAAVTMNPAWLLVAPVVGYGPAWIGHFVFEKNRPASWASPKAWAYSAAADFKMYGLALRGKMAAEVERFVSEAEAAAAAKETNGAAHADAGVHA